MTIPDNAGASVTLEWMVVRTHHNKEKQTSLALEAKGFCTYLPLARVERRLKRGLLVARIKPLFTGYLFVEVDIIRRTWEALLYEPGIKQFVGYRDGQDHPLVVRHKDMLELRQCINAYGDAVPVGLSRPSFIAPGTLVQILEGPFRDLSATVKADKGSRIDVLLTLFGRITPATYFRENIAVAV